jgi:hypothetical protein
VLIDRSHVRWGLSCAVILAASGAAYAWASVLPGGARGGNAIGLALGTVAFAFMAFALLLGARKALVRRLAIKGVGLVPRLGSIGFWMRGHLWLGTLALPLALLHSGFRASGPLAISMLVLLVAVVVTGIIGLVIQHVVPHELATRERGQTTHEQTHRRTYNLVSDAHGLVKKTCDEALRTAREAQAVFRAGAATRAQEIAALAEAEKKKRTDDDAEREKAYARAVSEAQAARERLDQARERLDAARPEAPVKKAAPAPVPANARRSRASMGTRLVEPSKTALKSAPPDPATLVAPAELVTFYDEIALPFLLEPDSPRNPLVDELGSEVVFESIHHRVPEAHRAVLADLRASCDAVRRKAHQRSLYVLLHGWLFFHVPIAVLLVALAAIHAVMALRY